VAAAGQRVAPRRGKGAAVGCQAGDVALLGLGGSDCEALRDGWLGQPINAVSSMAYVLAGAYLLRERGRVVPAVALAAVGVGSALYHGPMPPGADLVHNGSLVGLSAVVVGKAWRRRLRRPPTIAVAAAATAVAINLLTRTGAPLCRPDSALQGHAAWHALTAVALAAWLGRPATRPDLRLRQAPAGRRGFRDRLRGVASSHRSRS
jgi:hypothetical protein